MAFPAIDISGILTGGTFIDRSKVISGKTGICKECILLPAQSCKLRFQILYGIFVPEKKLFSLSDRNRGDLISDLIVAGDVFHDVSCPLFEKMAAIRLPGFIELHNGFILGIGKCHGYAPFSYLRSLFPEYQSHNQCA